MFNVKTYLIQWNFNLKKSLVSNAPGETLEQVLHMQNLS